MENHLIPNCRYILEHPGFNKLFLFTLIESIISACEKKIQPFHKDASTCLIFDFWQIYILKDKPFVHHFSISIMPLIAVTFPRIFLNYQNHRPGLAYFMFKLSLGKVAIYNEHLKKNTKGQNVILVIVTQSPTFALALIKFPFCLFLLQKKHLIAANGEGMF